MKTIKPYLAFIALVILCQVANGQVIRGQYWNPIKGGFNWDQGRFRDQLTYPYQFRSTADTGSVSFVNNKFYGKKIVNGVETWVPFADSTMIATGGNTKLVFQYSDNINVTVGDTTTALVLNQTTPNSTSRVVTLKDVSVFSGTELRIYNYNAGINLYTLASEIIDYDGTPTASLENQTTYILNSDGSYWRVLSKTKFFTGGGGTGGSSGVDLINLD